MYGCSDCVVEYFLHMRVIFFKTLGRSDVVVGCALACFGRLFVEILN